MAHFAELDENNTVLRVIAVPDEEEHRGEEFCSNLLGGRWKQTSYNATMRMRFAGAGFSYNEQLDAFIEPKPFDSWLLNKQTAAWESPVKPPEFVEGFDNVWVEKEQKWIQVEKGAA